jgi:peroxiredoxin
VALLHLRSPNEFVIAQAIGSRQTLLYQNGRDAVIDNSVLAARYAGEAMVFDGAASQLFIEEPVRLVQVTSVGSGAETVDRIVVQNRGRRALTLRVGEASCGCTGAELSAKTLAPGASAILTIRMHTDSDRLVTVNLHTDEPQRPRAVVAIQSQMPRSTIVPPQRIAMNSRLGQKTTASTLLALPSDVSVISATTQSAFIKANVASEKNLSPAPGMASNLYRVYVALSESAPAGAFTDQVVLRLQGGDVRQVVVPISGFVSDDVTVTPPMLLLGNVAAGSTIRKTVVVQGPEKKPFSIRSSKGKSVNVIARADPSVVSSAHAVDIVITAQGAPSATLQDRITLTLSDSRILEVDVFGTIQRDGESTTTPVRGNLDLNQIAPDFTGQDMNGKKLRISDVRGKKNLLLTFFPRCFTGGCAGQLSSLQGEYSNFVKNDTEVWAVSVDAADGENGQRAFAAKLGLQFPLIPDTSRQLSMLYGAAQDVTDMAARQSVLIDKQGMVRLIDRDVKVTTHGTDILRKMRELGMTK